MLSHRTNPSLTFSLPWTCTWGQGPPTRITFEILRGTFLCRFPVRSLRQTYSKRLIIAGTINKLQGLYEGKSETGNANLWVYCNEDSFWFQSLCTKGDNPPQAVIAYENEDIFFNNWYITFCPQFYESRWTIPFRDMKSNLQRNNPEPDNMESYDGPPGTQGYIFFHETM